MTWVSLGNPGMAMQAVLHSRGPSTPIKTPPRALISSSISSRNPAMRGASARSHPAAVGRTYLLRDGEDLSTAELVRRLGAALGRRTALFPVPASLLKLGAGCVGLAAEAQRLLGSLTVDDRPIRQELEWNPPFMVEEGFAETAVWYRATRS